MAIKLTKGYIDRLVCEKTGDASDIIFDAEVPGMAIRVYATGRKVYLIDYRLQGRQKRLTLGDARILTLDSARRLARTKLAEVLSGADPLTAKEESRKALSVESLCRAYLEYSKAHKRSFRQDKNRIEGRIIPTWGKRRARDLTRADVASLFESIGAEEKHTEANHIVRLVSSLYSWAERTGHVPQGHLNPARGIRQFPSRPRGRWIQPDEWPGLFEALEAEESLYAKSAIWVLIFTGCRLSEVLGAKWENVDFERKELRLPETKNGTARTVPLSPPVMDLLQSLPRQHENPFIIPGERRGCHMVNLSKPWNRIRQRAGLPDVTLHDIRRSYGSILASEGVSMAVIQRLLGHSNVTVTSKVYAHLSPDTLADGTRQLGGKVLEFSRFKRKTQKEAQ